MGDILGGWLVAQMDFAAGSVAAHRAGRLYATVEVEKITFLSPVEVGDEVTVFAELIGVGRTSMRRSRSASSAMAYRLAR